MENDNKVKFTLRIGVNIYEELKELAEANKRSLNKEIEYALENYANQFVVIKGKVHSKDDIQ